MPVTRYVPNDSPYFLLKCAQAVYEGQAFFNKYLGALGATLDPMNKTTIDGWKVVIIKSGDTGEYTVAIQGTETLRHVFSDVRSFFSEPGGTVDKIVDWVKERQTTLGMQVSNVTGHSQGGLFADLAADRLRGCITVTFNGHDCVASPTNINFRLHGDMLSKGITSNKANYFTIGKKGHKLKYFLNYIKPGMSWSDVTKEIRELNRTGNVPALPTTENSVTASPDNSSLIAEQTTPTDLQEQIEPTRIPVGEIRVDHFDSVGSASVTQGLSAMVMSSLKGLIFAKEKSKKQIAKDAVREGVEIGLVAGSGQFASNIFTRYGSLHNTVPFVGTVVVVYQATKKIFRLFIPLSQSKSTEVPPQYFDYLKQKCSAKELDLSRTFSDLTQQEKDCLFQILSEGDAVNINDLKHALAERSKKGLRFLFVKYVKGQKSLIKLNAIVSENQQNNFNDANSETDPFENCYVNYDLFSHDRLILRKYRALSGPGLCPLLTEIERNETEMTITEGKAIEKALKKSEWKMKIKTVVVTVANTVVEVVAKYFLPFIGSLLTSVVSGEAARRKEVQYENEALESKDQQLLNLSEKRINRLDGNINQIKSRIKEIKAIKTSRNLLWRIVTMVAWCLTFDLEQNLNKELTQLRAAKFVFQLKMITN